MLPTLPPISLSVALVGAWHLSNNITFHIEDWLLEKCNSVIVVSLFAVMRFLHSKVHSFKSHNGVSISKGKMNKLR